MGRYWNTSSNNRLAIGQRAEGTREEPTHTSEQVNVIGAIQSPLPVVRVQGELETGRGRKHCGSQGFCYCDKNHHGVL